jgi:crossover junction endodeoxyribonuclease RuvC
VIVIGLDPGLQATGWGIIEAEGNRLRHIANGTVRSRAADPLSDRLVQLYDAIEVVIAEHRPAAAAVEETFVNTNPQSTLKLGQARGVVMLVAAKAGLPVAEYAARFVKKAIVGTGAADKVQIQAMIARLLPGCGTLGPDAADALAVAITHAHMAGMARTMAGARAMA